MAGFGEQLAALQKKQDGVFMTKEQALQKLTDFYNNSGLIQKEKALSDKIGSIKTDELQKEERVKGKRKTSAELNEERVICRSVVFKGIQDMKIQVDQMSDSQLVEYVTREIVGYSILEELEKRPGVTDIYINDYNNVWMREKGKDVRAPLQFESRDHCEQVVRRLLLWDRKEYNEGDKSVVDAQFLGNRIALLSPAVTNGKLALSIRFHSEVSLTIEDLVKSGVVSQMNCDFFRMAIQGEMFMIIGGVTGSGKTTTLRAFVDEYTTEYNKRLYIAEDTREFHSSNPNQIHATTIHGAVTLADLTRAQLRHRPRFSVIGEIRSGEEMVLATDAGGTGQGLATSMHGRTAVNIFNRALTNILMEMPSVGSSTAQRILADALQIIFVQEEVSGVGYRQTEITEIVYDEEADRVRFRPLLEYDELNDTWKLVNRLSRDKAKLLKRKGIADDLLRIYTELFD